MRHHPEYQYLNTLQQLLTTGERVPNRTGVDTFRTLGVTHRYNFEDGFPLFTSKRVWWKGIAHELLWFLMGQSNIRYLVENDIHIWDDDAYRVYLQKAKEFNPAQKSRSKEWFLENVLAGSRIHDYKFGDLGPVYGTQWREWRRSEEEDAGWTHDQIRNLVHGLKNNPTSRRHIVSAWNVADIDDMGLPPCHVMSQYTIVDGNKLWCHMYQRSCDMFLGVPFNVASYSLLTYMLASVCGLAPGGLIHTMHDCHIYSNHVEAVAEQLNRKPNPFPQLELNPDVKDIDDFKFEHFKIVNYHPHATIKADLNT